MPKQHLVVLKGADGSIEAAPMKAWLRLHPEHLPEGTDPGDSTSHQLRGALRKAGWRIEVSSDRVLAIEPGAKDDSAFVERCFRELGIDAQIDDIDDEEEITAGLERDLQDALRKNIGQLDRDLRIIDGGKERVTDAGRIDITAEDGKKQIVVIELKAGTATQDVIAQVLAYMSAVAETDKRPVRGIIVAGDFHKRVVLAARAVPSLQLRKYGFRFSFETIR